MNPSFLPCSFSVKTIDRNDSEGTRSYAGPSVRLYKGYQPPFFRLSQSSKWKWCPICTGSDLLLLWSHQLQADDKCLSAEMRLFTLQGGGFDQRWGRLSRSLCCQISGCARTAWKGAFLRYPRLFLDSRSWRVWPNKTTSKFSRFSSNKRNRLTSCYIIVVMTLLINILNPVSPSNCTDSTTRFFISFNNWLKSHVGINRGH